jgi:hypothetical protein
MEGLSKSVREVNGFAGMGREERGGKSKEAERGR